MKILWRLFTNHLIVLIEFLGRHTHIHNFDHHRFGHRSDTFGHVRTTFGHPLSVFFPLFFRFSISLLFLSSLHDWPAWKSCPIILFSLFCWKRLSTSRTCCVPWSIHLAVVCFQSKSPRFTLDSLLEGFFLLLGCFSGAHLCRSQAPTISRRAVALCPGGKIWGTSSNLSLRSRFCCSSWAIWLFSLCAWAWGNRFESARWDCLFLLIMSCVIFLLADVLFPSTIENPYVNTLLQLLGNHLLFGRHFPPCGLSLSRLW